MKMQLFIYLLCFVAVASVSLRAEPNENGPLFGGTVDGEFQITTTDQPIFERMRITNAAEQLCSTPRCPQLPNTAIQASATVERP